MKQLAVAALAVLALVAGATSWVSAEEAKTMAASGKVVSVDAQAKSVTVQVSEQGQMHNLTFALDPQAKIQRGGQAVALGEIKAGDSIKVDYRSADGKNVAVALDVRTS